jgi:hypothetical protein
MTRIESEKVEVKKSSEEIFNQLTDFRNFGDLMPSQVSNWSATKDSCSFTIQGMANIRMKIVETKPNNYIKIVSEDKTPFDFVLHLNLDEKGKKATEGQLIFEAPLNPFMKMMVEKPLRNFFNYLATKIKDI